MEVATVKPKAWLAEFLLIRGLFNGPSGRPLYTYQLSSEEFKKLIEVLRSTLDLATNPLHQTKWAACYCLFVAEKYRRHYDGSEGGWSWQGFDAGLSCHFNVGQHTRFVEEGLKNYWKRPIRMRANGRDLLGSLFLEGGLPWPLVQSDTHGFGRAVNKGLKHYYRAKSTGITVSSLLIDSERYLPKTFRTIETRELLAGIVEQLMFLVNQYPLKVQTDPCHYLDNHAKGWRSDFPIPLDEGNAVSLINDWLRDADKQKNKQEEALEQEGHYTCKHYFAGDFRELRIKTEVVLPKKDSFDVKNANLTSTRLELAFFEGDSLISRGGVVYATLIEDKIEIRYPRQSITLTRACHASPLSLRLICNGKSIITRYFDGSDLDTDHVPQIFSHDSEEHLLLGSGSCSVPNTSALAYLPSGFSMSPVGTISSELGAGTWYEVQDDCIISSDTDSFYLKLRAGATQQKLSLVGNILDSRSMPQMTYLGWPSLPNNVEGQEDLDENNQYANGKRILDKDREHIFGSISYSVKDSLNRTLLRRKFGVLPRDFSLSLHPSTQEHAARAVVNSSYPINCRVSDGNIKTNITNEKGQITIELYINNEELPPSEFSLEIFSSTCVDPVTLHAPFPYVGAKLLSSSGQFSKLRDLVVDELLGKQVMLYPDAHTVGVFKILLELRNNYSQKILDRWYTLKTDRFPTAISLFNYITDIQQMLGVTKDQDAYVKMSIGTTVQHLSLNIRRYNGRISFNHDDQIMVQNISDTSITGGAIVKAMLLPDPKRKSIVLDEYTTEGVGTGNFQIPYKMRSDGPWIIYPGKESKVKFRSYLYTPDNWDANYHIAPESLHEAARLYHPQFNNRVIDEQIMAMTIDLNHTGWQYLADMMNNFGYLPLSTFECWHAVSRNPTALALAILRLEMSEAFCDRIRDELAVIWECIPLKRWADVYGAYSEWLKDTGFPEPLIYNLLRNRENLLSKVVSGFNDLKCYLASGDLQDLRLVPIEQVLPLWYQDLRRRHQSDDHWPDELGPALSEWIFKQPGLPDAIKRLSNIRYADSVTFLPIFMAYVTAGEAELSELSHNIEPFRLRYLIRRVSDFDRPSWYEPVHAMYVCHALADQ